MFNFLLEFVWFWYQGVIPKSFCVNHNLALSCFVNRKAWQALANVPVEDAMIKFCQILEKGSALYEPYMEAQKRDKEEKERKLKEEMERRKREEEERKRKEEEERKRAEEEENQRKLEEELARKKLAEEAEALRKKTEVENQRLIFTHNIFICICWDISNLLF